LIFVQGDLKEKNFDIRKTAGGKSYIAVYKKYNATVSKNFLEIHLFWAGKGTCCIPTQGYYGPMISALSVTPSTVCPNLLIDYLEWILLLDTNNSKPFFQILLLL